MLLSDVESVGDLLHLVINKRKRLINRVKSVLSVKYLNDT